MAGKSLSVRPDQPLRLSTGRLSASLEHGALRDIRLDGITVLDGIYAAVRDRNWRTIAPAFVRYEARQEDGLLAARVDADCRREEDRVDVTWSLQVNFTETDGLSVRFDALVRQSLLRTRIGLCVLHPLRMAGSRLVIVTPWGTVRGTFPSSVTANLPFSNIAAMRQDVGRATEVELRFAGDLFQMEDQRAFIDPSFKTFSTPLELPWPVQVDEGTRITQSIEVRPARRDAARRLRRTVRRPIQIKVTGEAQALPVFGTQLPGPEVELDDAVLTALGRIRPAFLRVDMPDPAGAPAQLNRALQVVAQLRIPLAVALVCSDEEAVTAYAATLLPARAEISRISVFHPRRHTTAEAVLLRAKEAFAQRWFAGQVGGGSRGYPYQLLLDGVPSAAEFVEFAASPQVHACDPASILDTVDAIPPLMSSLAELSVERPIHVGPLTMRALVNPDEIDPEAVLAPGALPRRYDRRQTEILTATWTVAMLATLAGTTAASVTLHEAAGWGGLVAARQEPLPPMPASPGTLLPVGEALAAVRPRADDAGRRVVAPPKVGVTAVVGQNGWRLVAASREAEALVAEVSLPQAFGAVSAWQLVEAGTAWSQISADVVSQRKARVILPPRGVVRLDSS